MNHRNLKDLTTNNLSLPFRQVDCRQIQQQHHLLSLEDQSVFEQSMASSCPHSLLSCQPVKVHIEDRKR